MSLKTFVRVAGFVLPVLAAAQAPTNSADVVPEKMPFDIAYGPAVSLDMAEVMLNASMAEAKKRNWKLNCAVLDSGAHLVSFKRMDGGAIASISIAMHKARTAVKFVRLPDDDPTCVA